MKKKPQTCTITGFPKSDKINGVWVIANSYPRERIEMFDKVTLSLVRPSNKKKKLKFEIA